MAYCTVNDVLELIPNRNITENSNVINTGDVERLITHADNIINLKLKVAGLYDKVGDLTNELKTIEALLVAGMVEARLKADDEGLADEEPNNALYKEGMKLLESIQVDNRLDYPENPSSDINSFVDNVDSNEELKALFEKNTRQW